MRAGLASSAAERGLHDLFTTAHDGAHTVLKGIFQKVLQSHIMTKNMPKAGAELEFGVLPTDWHDIVAIRCSLIRFPVRQNTHVMPVLSEGALFVRTKTHCQFATAR